jgi:flagellar biosynthesis/type III secretory pathway chaperone
MTRSAAPTILVHVGQSGAPRAAWETSLRELNENLADLHQVLRRMLETAREKLAAIRVADTDALQACAVRETDLLQQVMRAEQQRTAILARLAHSVPTLDPKSIRLSELAGQFPEPFSSILRARSEALRRVATELQQKNQLLAHVAHHLQSHIRAVFAELAKVNQESVVYGPRGQHDARNARSWLDAVG